jgi:hypothetical protein
MSATAYIEMVDGGERSRRDEAQDQGGTRPSLNRLEDRTAALKNQLTKWSAVDFIFDTVRSKWYTVTSLAYVLAEFFYLTVLVPRDQLPQIFVFGSIWPSFYFCSLDYQLAHNYTSEQRATCSYTIQAFSFWVLIAYSIWVTCSEVLLISQVNNPKRSKLGWGMLALAYFGLYGFVWSSQTNNSVQLARLGRKHDIDLFHGVSFTANTSFTFGGGGKLLPTITEDMAVRGGFLVASSGYVLPQELGRNGMALMDENGILASFTATSSFANCRGWLHSTVYVDGKAFGAAMNITMPVGLQPVERTVCIWKDFKFNNNDFNANLNGSVLILFLACVTTLCISSFALLLVMVSTDVPQVRFWQERHQYFLLHTKALLASSSSSKNTTNTKQHGNGQRFMFLMEVLRDAYEQDAARQAAANALLSAEQRLGSTDSTSISKGQTDVAPPGVLHRLLNKHSKHAPAPELPSQVQTDEFDNQDICESSAARFGKSTTDRGRDMYFRVPTLAVLAALTTIGVLVLVLWRNVSAFYNVQLSIGSALDTADGYIGSISHASVFLETAGSQTMASLSAIVSSLVASVAATSRGLQGHACLSAVRAGETALNQTAASASSLQHHGCRQYCSAVSRDTKIAADMIGQAAVLCGADPAQSLLQNHSVMILDQARLLLNTAVVPMLLQLEKLDEATAGSFIGKKAQMDGMVVRSRDILKALRVHSQRAFSNAAAALIVAFPLVGAVAVLLVFKVNEKVLQVASGKIGKAEKKLLHTAPVTKATAIVGMQLSSALFGYAFTSSVLFVVFTLLSEPYIIESLWNALASSSSTLLGILLVLVLKSFLDFYIGRRRLSVNNVVLHRVLFCWYASIGMFIDLLKGMAAAVVRVFLVLGLACFSVSAIHFSMLPPGLKSMDAGYVSFLSTVMIAHRQNNPIWSSFAEVFARGKQGAGTHSESTVTGKRIAAAGFRWHLAFTLLNNPR